MNTVERSRLPGQWLEPYPARSAMPRLGEHDEPFNWQACWSNFRSIYGHREPLESSPIDPKRPT